MDLQRPPDTDAPCQPPRTDSMVADCFDEIARETERVAVQQEEQRVLAEQARVAEEQRVAQDAQQVTYAVSTNDAKAFIYSHESGNDPTAWNSSGCFGLGQACPGQWLYDSCGYDYACQDAYFESYMVSRYGSWEAAYAFWNGAGNNMCGYGCW